MAPSKEFYLWEHRKMKVVMEKMSWARLIEDSCKRRDVWNYGAMEHGERGQPGYRRYH